MNSRIHGQTVFAQGQHVLHLLNSSTARPGVTRQHMCMFFLAACELQYRAHIALSNLENRITCICFAWETR